MAASAKQASGEAPGCRLYLVTPPALEPARFAEELARALDAGDVACVQLRLKEADDDAIRRAVEALRPVAQARGGRLWCVFGCGGNRDARKRPLMGAAAQQGADAVLVTSDNPRGEVPQAIIDQILQGMAPGAQAEPDRAAAIAQAVARADATDVVLIAGKGHEDYQEVQGVRHPFSDMAQARQALTVRQGGAA